MILEWIIKFHKRQLQLEAATAREAEKMFAKTWIQCKSQPGMCVHERCSRLPFRGSLLKDLVDLVLIVNNYLFQTLDYASSLYGDKVGNLINCKAKLSLFPRYH